MVYSICKEYQIECVSWDDPPLFGMSFTSTTTSNNSNNNSNNNNNNNNRDIMNQHQQQQPPYMVSHFRSFLSFVEGSVRYKEMDSDSIRETCRRLVVIDLLPTSLLQTSREGVIDDRVRKDM